MRRARRVRRLSGRPLRGQLCRRLLRRRARVQRTDWDGLCVNRRRWRIPPPADLQYTPLLNRGGPVHRRAHLLIRGCWGADGGNPDYIATVASDAVAATECTGTADDGSSTCDLLASTDGTADCPAGCDSEANLVYSYETCGNKNSYDHDRHYAYLRGKHIRVSCA